MKWDTVIGLEVHVQLNTQSKIFSGASTHYGASPNTQATMIDLALPGMLPVLNEQAVVKAIQLGLAIDAEIAKESVFARKNYFYPDLPKGYQISQFEFPIVGRGALWITTDEGRRKIGVTRAHLEEDAGKSVHGELAGFSGIDLNRAGVPLLEVVSEPEMTNAKEAVAYLKALHTLVRYLDISDGNMQEGSFRCDANISVKRSHDTELGTRAEIKNINSFRFVERAINFEVARQIDILESGGKIVQETRLYDSEKDETRSMRSKEAAQDYRYFPDPDLLPLVITTDYIEKISAQMPELPDAKAQRFVTQYGLNDYDAGVLTATRRLADYYEQVVEMSQAEPKLVSNWITGELLGALNKADLDITESPVQAHALAQLLVRLVDQTLSGKLAKQVFEAMWHGEGGADDIIKQRGLVQITDTKAIESLIQQVMEANPHQLAQYRAGKDKLFGFFVGQIMKLSEGKANPDSLNELLKQKLSED